MSYDGRAHDEEITKARRRHGLSEKSAGMPAVIVMPSEFAEEYLQKFINEVGEDSSFDTTHGYAGKMLDVVIWIDDRFDNVVFISGKA